MFDDAVYRGPGSRRRAILQPPVLGLLLGRASSVERPDAAGRVPVVGLGANALHFVWELEWRPTSVLIESILAGILVRMEACRRRSL
jgi:hypothetical protein